MSRAEGTRPADSFCQFVQSSLNQIIQFQYTEYWVLFRQLICVAAFLWDFSLALLTPGPPRADHNCLMANRWCRVGLISKMYHGRGMLIAWSGLFQFNALESEMCYQCFVLFFSFLNGQSWYDVIRNVTMNQCQFTNFY